MQSWTLIDTARVPGGVEELRLMQRGTEFIINVGTALLMGSRQRGSEGALATLGCAALKGRSRGGRVLVGGLGMGFTLRAALDVLGPEALIEVAELVPAVADWVRGPLAHLSDHPLTDARVHLLTADIARLLKDAIGVYDAILLDVDNGPKGLTRIGNGDLYSTPGLRSAWRALAAGGVLAVWSAFPDRDFDRRLANTGFVVKEHFVRAQGSKGTRHVIWIAARPSLGRRG